MRQPLLTTVVIGVLFAAIPSFAVPTVFETTTANKSVVYAFGSALSSETQKDNIGSESSCSSGRFAFRAGTVNVRTGGYLHFDGYDESKSATGAQVHGNWIGANSDPATLNIDGGTFWVDVNGKTNDGAGLLRVGVNGSSDGTPAATLNLKSGYLRVDKVLCIGGTIYCGYAACRKDAVVNISGGTAKIAKLNLGTTAPKGTTSNPGYADATLNLTGGTLETTNFNFAAYHSQIFVWGSGTIRAEGANIFTSLPVTIGAGSRSVNVTGNPAIFDTGNFEQTIPADIASGSGTLKLTGGNTVTLSAAPSFRLWLDGTTLAFNSALGRNLTVPALTIGSGAGIAFDADLLLAGEAFTLTATGGFTLPDGGSVLDFVQINGSSAADCEKTLSADGKTITVSKPGDPDYTWCGTAANWDAVDVWMNGGSNATWADNNNAIFNTANATVTLNNDVTAAGVVFSAEATISTNGTDAATLTVPIVSVANGVSATISAPTVGALEKTGAGALTLTENRTDVTTLTEGTLALSGTASLDWSQFMFGTDSAKPVTLEVGPTATIANIPSIWEVKSANGVDTVFCKQGGDWSLSGQLYLGGTSGATASFQHNGGNLTVGGYLSVGEEGTGLLDICGGTVNSTHSETYTLIGNNSAGTVVVTNGGSLVVSASVAVGNNADSSGTLVVADGSTVSVGGSLIFCNRNASTSGRIDLRRGGVIAAVNAYRKNAGSATFNFDGGMFVKASETGNVFPANGVVSAIDVSVSTNGGTIDNNRLAITIPCTITGVGGLTLSGAGTTTVSADQSYTGTTTISNGTTLSVGGGVTFAGPVVFAAGSALDIAEYVGGVTPLSATSLTFPESGNVPLTFNGDAFITGAYAICPTSLVSVAQAVAKFAPSTGGLGCSWDVSATGDLLLLVGDIHGYSWTGLAGDNKFATGGNWVSGIAPSASGPVDFSAVTSDITVDMDGVTAGTIFGAVTMGTGVITFTNAMAATSFSDTSKVAVAADSTVTLNNDLVFSDSTENKFIINTVAEGGVFRVTGRIVLTRFTGAAHLGGSVANICPGTIAAKGLFNDCGPDTGNLPRFVLGRNVGNYQGTWAIGSDGLDGSGGFQVAESCASAKIVAEADFVDSAKICNKRSLVIDVAGHVVTLGTNTLAGSGGIYGGGNTTIVGGRVVANYDVDNLTTYTLNNPFTVDSGATLEIVTGADLGTGAVTVQDGGTLEVAESGTVTLNGDLSLADGATLGFNFTDRRVAPQIAVAQGKAVTVSGAVKVKVSDALWPTAGDYVLTACGGFDAEGVAVTLPEGSAKWAKGVRVNDDGNIVLTVKPRPTMIIVK